MATRKRTTTRSTRARPAPKRAAVPAPIRKLQARARQALNAGTQAATSVRETAMDMVDAARKQGKVLEMKAREARKAVASGAEEARTRTVQAVSQLERVFERRVSKVITKLGVPSARDVRALTKQVAELQASVDQLRRSRGRARAHA